eukprot:COSAG06_NODE_1126_length_10609_cov_228.247383_5_plen_181_part_00
MCACIASMCVCVCVCVNSGAGKSSSLDMLCGIEPPTRGAVTVEGKSTAEQLPDVHSRTALCPQLVRFLLVAFLAFVGKRIQAGHMPRTACLSNLLRRAHTSKLTPCAWRQCSWNFNWSVICHAIVRCRAGSGSTSRPVSTSKSTRRSSPSRSRSVPPKQKKKRPPLSILQRAHFYPDKLW